MRKEREELGEVTLILRDLKSETWTIRQDAVCRIGRLDDPLILAELMKRAEHEKWHIREMVAAGIRPISNPELAEPMKEALVGGDDCIRDACARSLGLMRCRDAEHLLEKAVADPDCRVRKTACMALELIRERGD
jgi:HEAT repeat protein